MRRRSDDVAERHGRASDIAAMDPRNPFGVRVGFGPMMFDDLAQPPKPQRTDDVLSRNGVEHAAFRTATPIVGVPPGHARLGGVRRARASIDKVERKHRLGRKRDHLDLVDIVQRVDAEPDAQIGSELSRDEDGSPNRCSRGEPQFTSIDQACHDIAGFGDHTAGRHRKADIGDLSKHFVVRRRDERRTGTRLVEPERRHVDKSDAQRFVIDGCRRTLGDHEGCDFGRLETHCLRFVVDDDRPDESSFIGCEPEPDPPWHERVSVQFHQLGLVDARSNETYRQDPLVLVLIKGDARRLLKHDLSDSRQRDGDVEPNLATGA